MIRVNMQITECYADLSTSLCTIFFIQCFIDVNGTVLYPRKRDGLRIGNNIRVWSRRERRRSATIKCKSLPDLSGWQNSAPFMVFYNRAEQ